MQYPGSVMQRKRGHCFSLGDCLCGGDCKSIHFIMKDDVVRRSYSVESMHMFQQLTVHIAGAAQQGQMLVFVLSN